jgi:hypothetical protein
MKDVGIAQNQFNVGQQMLSLGIVLFEISSNMILYLVGSGKWLTLQLFLFGIVSTFQAFQKKRTMHPLLQLVFSLAWPSLALFLAVCGPYLPGIREKRQPK